MRINNNNNEYNTKINYTLLLFGLNNATAINSAKHTRITTNSDGFKLIELNIMMFISCIIKYYIKESKNNYLFNFNLKMNEYKFHYNFELFLI